MKTRLCAALVVITTLVTIAPAAAGGWSVLTLDAWPESVVANRPTTIGFVVRQHGQRPLADLTGRVIFERPGQTARTFPIAASGAAGHYVATFTLPSAGVWKWRIVAFGEHPMPSLTVRTAAAASMALAQPAVSGRDLFVAKGCWMCHAHRDVPESGAFGMAYGGGGAPILNEPRLTPAAMRVWLKDPKSVRPKTEMPNLGLDSAEIDALVSFLAAQARAEPDRHGGAGR